MRIKSLMSLIGWVVLLFGMSALISSITKTGMSGWYDGLNRSSLTPPGYVFGIVWSVLYAMIAVAGWQLWASPASNKGIKRLFIIQLLLNWAWTPLFFYYHRPDWSLLCSLFLLITLLCLIKKTIGNLKRVALLLIPYAIWGAFALYLNTYIWLYN